jgi:putative nucleotidyltransferase with HDIG domain
MPGRRGEIAKYPENMRIFIKSGVELSDKEGCRRQAPIRAGDTMKKTIDINDLKLGMFMIGVEESWLKTPFFFHRRLISQESDIVLLKRYGIQKVVIDPARGGDVESPPTEHPGQADPEPSMPVPEPDWSPKRRPEEACMEELAAAKVIRAEAVAAIERIFDGVKTGVSLDSPALKMLVNLLMNELLAHQASMTTIVLLQQMRRCDGNLFEHAVDVGVLALVLGQDAGLDATTLQQLGLGALLHDIGKLRLPHNLLRKVTELTPQEKVLMRMHPQLGSQIVAQAQELDAVCHRIVGEHHEVLDGSGYPNGLKQEAILLQSQIVGLVDRYETLSGGRGGRPPMFPAQAVRDLYQLGLNRCYDLALVERMIRCLGIYPVGSLVELNTAERGIVIMQNRADRLKPVIKLLWAEDGRPYAMPEIIDLSAVRRPRQSERSVKCVLDPAREQVNIAACIEEIGVAASTPASPGADSANRGPLARTHA